MNLLNGKISWLLGACVVAVTVAAVTHKEPAGTGVSDAGERLVTESRPVPAGVTTVVLDGPINLTLRQGAAPALAVRAEGRVLPNIGTTVDGASLRIAPQGMLLRPRQPIDVTLTLPALASLRTGGSGDTTVAGFGGPRLDLAQDGSGDLRFDGRYAAATIAQHGSGTLDYAAGSVDSIAIEAVGSGDATLRGTAHTLRATLVGSGDLDAGALRADDVVVVQQGSGDSEVDARASVTVELQGSGDAVVTGKPAARTVRRTGSGDVVFKD